MPRHRDKELRLLATKAKRKLSMHDRILEGAERCFERHGIVKTTLSDIAEEAGVSRVSVYRQFPDRETLVSETNLHILKQRWQGIADQIAHISDPAEWLMEALLQNVRQHDRDNTDRHYWEDTVLKEIMVTALSERGLECVAVHLRKLLAGHNSKLACNMSIDDMSEWLHWQSFVIFNYRGQRSKSENRWREYFTPLVHGGIFS